MKKKSKQSHKKLPSKYWSAQNKKLKSYLNKINVSFFK